MLPSTEQRTPLSVQDPTSASAKGKVLQTRDGGVVFQPRGTNYELHLQTDTPYEGAIGKPVTGMIRLHARKVYTVASGGNFIAPIMGTPRTVQGRVLSVAKDHIVLHAGAPVVIELPSESHAIDLGEGSIAPGVMLNAVVLPGAAYLP
ncbi:MAG: hypothetical protein AAGK78_15885 [Planctomycetota bacterium]